MRNVLDIKKEDNLNFFLPMKYCLESDAHIKHSSIIVIIHLHYKDTVMFYLDYIKNIPKGIRILFTTSDPETAAIIDQLICNWRVNYQIIIKENRGRDISAFLVACRSEILKYEYCCFLHDKKEKIPVFLKDTQKWIRCLWENTIGSEMYILNVLKTFASNPQLGVLAPPPVLTPHFGTFYGSAWYRDYDLTKKLTEDLGLHCNLDSLKAPITIGTVFWAKISALTKLLQKEWCYDDFPPEPLPDDGTISHAIERVLAYVAQDAGYDTGWIMTDQYAGEEFEYIQEVLQNAFSHLRKYAWVRTIAGLDSFDRINEELIRFCEAHKKIFIYGKGDYGKECLSRMRFLNKKVEAFLVTNSEGVTEFDEIPVHEISEEYLCEENGVIIAVSFEKQDEIMRIIQSKNAAFSSFYHYDGIWSNMMEYGATSDKAGASI